MFKNNIFNLAEKVDKRISEIESNYNNISNFSKELAIYLTVYLWSNLDCILRDDDTYSFFIEKIKYKDLNEQCLNLFLDLFTDKYKKFSFLNEKNEKNNFQKFLLKIINKEEKFIESDDCHFFTELFNESKNINISGYGEKYSYFFISIILQDSEKEIDTKFKSFETKMKYIDYWKELKRKRNSLVHTDADDISIKNIENWKKLYWEPFNNILNYIANTINNGSFLNKMNSWMKKNGGGNGK